MARRMDVTILEQMARRRGQKTGHVFQRCGAWYGRYLVDSPDEIDSKGKPKRTRITVHLGDAKGPEKIGKRQADAIMQTEYLPQVNAANMRPSSAKPLADFVTKKFYPDYLPTLKKTGQTFYRSILKKHVLPSLGTVRLRDINSERVQSLLTSKGRSGLSTQTVVHIRNCLSAVLRFARSLGWFAGQLPTEDRRLPPMVREERRAPTWDQVCALSAVLPDSCALLVLFLTLTGLRIGEAMGLRWKHVNLTSEPKILDMEVLPPFSLAVRENYVMGQYGTLKSKESRRLVPIPEWFVPRLAALSRTSEQGSLVDHSTMMAPVFANSSGAAPIDQHHLQARVLKPAAAALGWGTAAVKKASPAKGCEGPTRPAKPAESWISWHCLRHTFATLTDTAGLTVSERMKLLGHTDGAVTAGYTHPEFQSIRAKLAALPTMEQPKARAATIQ